MIQDAIVNTGYKLFPDSRAARRDPGHQAPAAGEELSAEQKAFERATRGTHW
jgi:hypothetical protein